MLLYENLSDSLLTADWSVSTGDILWSAIASMCCFSIIGSVSVITKKICRCTFPGAIHTQDVCFFFQRNLPHLFHFIFTGHSLGLWRHRSSSNAAVSKTIKRGASEQSLGWAYLLRLGHSIVRLLNLIHWPMRFMFRWLEAKSLVSRRFFPLRKKIRLSCFFPTRIAEQAKNRALLATPDSSRKNSISMNFSQIFLYCKFSVVASLLQGVYRASICVPFSQTFATRHLCKEPKTNRSHFQTWLSFSSSVTAPLRSWF